MSTWPQVVNDALERLCGEMDVAPDTWAAFFEGGWAEAGPALARKVARRRGGVDMPAEAASPVDRLVAAIERAIAGQHGSQVVSSSDIETLQASAQDPAWHERLIAAIGAVDPGGQLIARRYTDRQVRLIRVVLDARPPSDGTPCDIVAADALAGPDPVVLTVSDDGAGWVLSSRPLTEAEHVVARLLREGAPPLNGRQSLWVEAAHAGVDLDLWLAARAATPEELAVGELIELLAVRRGWAPLPTSLVDAVAEVIEDARAAVAERRPAAGPTTELLGRLDAIGGIWGQLQGGMILTPDGVSFPFPEADVELLRALARHRGDGSRAADALGPLTEVRLRVMSRSGGGA